MPLVHIRFIGDSGLAFVHTVSGPVDPGYGTPGGGVDPGFGLPEGGRPGNALPPSWPGYPTTGPVFPGRPVDPGYGIRPGRVWWPVDPDYGVPERPPHPSHGLPDTPPPVAPAGKVVVLVRDAAGKWHYAIVDQGAVQPTSPMVPPPTAAPKS